MAEDEKTRVFGFEYKGDEEGIVEKSKEIQDILNEEEYEEAEEWEKWRPKKDEDIDEEMRKRSVEKTSIGEESADKNRKKAEKNLEEAKEKIDENYFLETFYNLKKYVKEKIIEILKLTEKILLYKMSKYSPKYYEDNKFNSSIEENTSLTKDDGEYKMKVNFEKEEINEKAKEKVKD